MNATANTKKAGHTAAVAARREEHDREQHQKNGCNGDEITQLVSAGALGIAEQGVGEGS